MSRMPAGSKPLGGSSRTSSLGSPTNAPAIPRLLTRDEPTNGLDPAGIRDMRSLVRSLAENGPTVLVSSHLLAEVQQVCDWLVVIEHGRRVFQGPTARLLAGHDS